MWRRELTPCSPAWFTRRSEIGYTASVIGEAIGFGYGSINQAWEFLTLRKSRDESNKHARNLLMRGREAELFIVKQFADVFNVPCVWTTGPFERNGVLATPDAIVFVPHKMRQVLLECKTTTNWNRFDEVNGPPLSYVTQVYVQMYCTGIKHGFIAATTADEFRVYQVRWVAAFWLEHVVPGLVEMDAHVKTDTRFPRQADRAAKRAAGYAAARKGIKLVHKSAACPEVVNVYHRYGFV